MDRRETDPGRGIPGHRVRTLLPQSGADRQLLAFVVAVLLVTVGFGSVSMVAEGAPSQAGPAAVGTQGPLSPADLAATGSGPTASRDSPSAEITVEAGTTVEFTLDASDGDCNLAGTEWYVEGSFEEAVTDLSGCDGTVTWSRTFDETGTYTVEGLAYDGDWQYSSAVTWEVTVTDGTTEHEPNASRVTPDTSTVRIEAGESVEFGAEATDADGDLYTAEWYVDGSYVKTNSLSGDTDTTTFSRTFDATGTHTVDTVVYDDDWNSAGVSWTVDVEASEPPTLTRESPAASVSLAVDDSQTFEVTASDANGDLSEVRWSVDGEQVATATVSGGSDVAGLNHSFSSVGEYTVTAVGYDEDGDGSDPVAWSVDVTDDTDDTDDSDSGSADGFRGRAIYVWTSQSQVRYDSVQDDFFARLDQRSQFDDGTIYLYWGTIRDEPEADVAAFVERAHANGYRVEAMIDGGSHDMTAIDRAETQTYEVFDFDDRHPASQSFDGIHYDVEPDGSVDLKKWLREYDRMMDSVAADSRTADYTMSAAVGWWWADSEPKRTEQLVDNDLLDYVGVMTVHDTESVIRDRVTTTMQGTDTPYVVIAEAADWGCSNDCSGTIYEEGETHMNTILASIDQNPPVQDGRYRGTAVHYYWSPMTEWISL